MPHPSVKRPPIAATQDRLNPTTLAQAVLASYVHSGQSLDGLQRPR